MDKLEEYGFFLLHLRKIANGCLKVGFRCLM